MFVPQDQEEDVPAESASPERSPSEGAASEGAASESASSDLDDFVSVNQPGASMESPLLVDDNEEEESAEPERPEVSQGLEEESATGDDQSDYGQDDRLPEAPRDKDLREGIAACGGIPCQDQIDQYKLRIRLRDAYIEDLRKMLQEKNARLRVLDGRITDFVLQVVELGGVPVHNQGRVPQRPSRSASPQSIIHPPHGMYQWQMLLYKVYSKEAGKL
jgi:hypothetical protein